MKRLVLRVFPTSLVLAMVALLVLAVPASAGRAWCRADPIMTIDGEVVDVYISSNLQMFLSASGPIQMVVTVPQGVKANVVLHDLGFLRGYKTKIEYSSDLQVRSDGHVPIRVAVYAPARSSSLPVSVTVVPTGLSLLHDGLLKIDHNHIYGGTAEGRANQWIVFESN